MTPPVVAVYRKAWVGWDLTFLQNQVGALSRWKAFRMVGAGPTDGKAILMDYQLPVSSEWDTKISRRVPLFWYLRKFQWDLWRHHVRVIHVHFGTDAGDFLRYARWAKRPLVVTFHGYDVTKDVDGDDEICVRNRKRLAAVFAEASLLIAVSNFIADRLRALGAPESKIRIHYMGIPHREFPDAARVKKDVFFVGRFVEKKGVDDVIAAFARLPQSLRDEHRLRLVGSGPQEPELRALAERLGVEVDWLGWRPGAEIYEFMAQAALFCGPSKRASHGDSEGLGMVFLEAQSEGTPVLSTRSGGIPDAVLEGETGVLVDEGNVEQLAAAMEALLSDPVRLAAMGQAGARFVREKFDIVTQTRLLEELYDEVLH